MSVEIIFACPRCGYRVDAASEIRGNEYQPKPGDISLCLRCGAPLEFQAAGAPRWLTYEELAEIIAGDKVEARARLIQAILHIVTMRPSGVQAVPWKEPVA